MRRLPAWVAGGPKVSTLAYQIVCEAFGDPPRPPAALRPRDETARLIGHGPGTGAVVAHLSERLDADEADVLRAMAELERAGVLTK